MRLATRSPAPLFGCDAATSTHKSRRGGDLCTYRRCYWGHDSEAGPPRRAAGAVAGPPQRTPGRAPACQCCSLARGVAGRGLQVAASEVPPAAIMMARPANASAACGGRALARGAGPPGARGAGRAVGRPRLGAGGSRGRRRQLPPRWQLRVRGSYRRLGLPDGPCGLDGRPPRLSAGSHWRFASDGPGGTARRVSSVHRVRSGRSVQVPQCAGVRQCGAGSAAAALRLHSAACHCGSCSFPTTTAQLTNRNVLQVASAGLSFEERRQMQRPTHMPAKRRPARGQAADSKLSFDGSKLQLAQ